jgi:putative ABC transport system permease protein
MFKHYLLTSLRSLRRHWVSTLINISGLAMGLLCLIGAYNLIEYFKLDDSQYAGSDRTYVVVQQYLMTDTQSLPTFQRAPWLMAAELKAALPELEIARVVDYRQTPITARDTAFDIQTSFADAAFLRLFPVPFVRGDITTALVNPRSAILTKESAERLFGNDDVVGKQVLIYGAEPVTITGVFSIPVQPTHLLEAMELESATRFEMLVSMDMLTTVKARDSSFAAATQALQNWRTTEDAITYVRLPANRSINVATLDAQLTTIGSAHTNEGQLRRYSSRPIAEFRQLGLNNFVESGTTGFSWDQVLLAIAWIIVTVSCLNYANLTTAIAAQHRRELGIRRALGASTLELIAQSLLEATLLVTTAVVLAMSLLGAINPLLRAARNIDLLYVWSHSSQFWVEVVIAGGVVVMVASALPIFTALGVGPTAALQSSKGGAQRQAGTRWLISVQFLLAGVLLVFLFVVRTQQNSMFEHARNSINGPVVAIRNNLNSTGVSFALLRAELLRQPHVLGVTSTSFAPWGRSYGLVTIANSRDAAATDVSAINEQVDDRYFATLDIRVLAGETFRTNASSNGSRSEFPIVIDRTMATQLGWSSVQSAIGQLIYPGKAIRNMNPEVAFRVIGVVEDRLMQFTTSGARGNIYVSNADRGRTPLVRVSPQHLQDGLADIKNVWKNLAPHFALRAQLVDEIVADYASETSVYANALSFLTLLAVGIALAGLAGMSIHVVNRRLHEIGIRKTLGAKARQIVGLLLNDFSRPIIIGSIVGWPIAYFVAQKYLAIYLHRVELTPVPFVASLIGVLIISFAAVSWHTARAARLKPIDILRHE